MILHRIHEAKFDANGFNPGSGNSRFSPFTVAGMRIPTSYAATSLECATFETIFHEVDPSAAFKTVPLSLIERLSYSTFELGRDLYLATFYSADLMKFGLERRHVIDTPKTEYATTRLWSPAVHQSDPKAAGMVWISRKYDQEKSIMFFGDRVASKELIPTSSVRIVDHAHTLETIFELGQRAGIDISG